MTETESEKALDFIQEHFMFLEQRSGDSTTIESVLDRLQQAILRLGVGFCVIDPYNYIVRDQHQDEHEHQFINKMLTRLVHLPVATMFTLLWWRILRRCRPTLKARRSLQDTISLGLMRFSARQTLASLCIENQMDR